MADKFSALRTSRGEPSLFEQVRTAAQITPEAQYEMTSGASDTQLVKGLRTGAAGITAGSFANQALSQEAGGNEDWQRSRDLALQTHAQGQMYAPRVSSLRDIGSLEDAGDFAAGAFGQGVMSMAPVVATAFASRVPGASGLLAKALPYASAAVPAYMLEKGEAALNQYADPTLAKTSVEDRDLAATTKGVINAGLEAAVPAGLANSFLRKPATSLLGTIGRSALGESATEAAQEYVGYRAEKALDPNRQLDPWRIADAAAMGALTGGGVSAVTSTPGHLANSAMERMQAQQDDAAAPPQDGGDPTQPPGPIDPNTPLLPAPDDGSGGGEAVKTAPTPEEFLRQFFSSSPGMREQAQKTKDFVSDTIDRMGEAVKTAQTPEEFLRQVFSSSPEDAAAADLLHDTEDPGVMSAADPAAALQQRDAERQERAAFFAEELLNDPATPDAVKERVASFGGDFTNPEARAFVARNLVAQRAGEKLVRAVSDLIDMSKDLGGRAAEAGADLAAKARGMLDKSMTAAADRITKKNLQGISLVDAKPLVDVLAQRLGPSGAAKAPELARQLLALSVRMSPETRITPEVDSRLRSLSDAIDDDVLDMVTEVSGSDGLRQALARIREIPSAQTDVATSDGSSFLESMLVRPLADGQRKQLATVIDEAGLQLKDLNPTRRNQLLTGLAAAFGSKENAQTVVEYYGNLRREAMQRNASNSSDSDDLLDQSGEDVTYEAPRPTGDAYEGTDGVAEYGTLPERDAPEQDTYYADPKSMRPFYEGREGRLSTEGGTRRRVRDIEAFMDRMRGLGVELRPQRYGAFLKERNGDSAAAVKRIRKDLEKRIAEGAPRKGEAAEYAEGRKKNRQYLEEQLLALNLIEQADGPEAAANLFSVARAVGERNELGITDDQLAKADTLLRSTVNPKKPPRGMDWAQATKHNRDILKTKIIFNRTGDGAQPLALSAESLWKAYAKGQPAGRPMRQLFADAVSAVLNRPDIADLAHGLDGVLIDRESGTYADPQMSDDVREVKKELAHEYEARLSEAESRVEAAASEIEDARDEDRADDELVERIEVAAAELQREADSGRITATALKDEAKSIKWEDGAPTPEAIELRARAAWEYDISRVFAEGARYLHETATEVRSELERVEGGERGAAAKVRNYDESTGAALHPDDKPSAAKPKGLGKRLDAALLANPELLEVLDARGQPKDKAMTESRMRENLFKAYAAVKTPALKARLEGLRAKYQEAKNASNVGTPAAREAAKQEAAALKELGQMVRWILEQREGAHTDAAPKQEPATVSKLGSMENPHIVPMYYQIRDLGRIRAELRGKYRASDSIAALIPSGDRTGTTRRPPEGVMPGDYISFSGVPGVYRVTGFQKIDLQTTAGREAWSKREGWSVDAINTFGSQVRNGAIQMQFERADGKGKSRTDTESAPKRDDAMARLAALPDTVERVVTPQPPRRAAPAMPKRVILPKTSRYAAKDQVKSDRANKFIGRGAPGSSTAAYAEAWGSRANVGEYSPEDAVFISVNGNRPGALTPPWPEIKKAMSAGATLITDVPADRNRSFNTGERAVADFLDGNGYFEESPGTWVREKTSQGKVVKKSFIGERADPTGAARMRKAAERARKDGTAVDMLMATEGWFYGPDGKLRRELSAAEKAAVTSRVSGLIKRALAGETVNTDLKSLLGDVPSFAGYFKPRDFLQGLFGDKGRFANVSVKFTHSNDTGMGMFDDQGRSITLNVVSNRVNVSLQSPDVAASERELLELDVGAVLNFGGNLRHEYDTWFAGLPQSTRTKLEQQVADEMLRTFMHELQHAIQAAEGFTNGGNSLSAFALVYADPDIARRLINKPSNDTFEAATDSATNNFFAQFGPDADIQAAAQEAYENIVGELEASDVEARLNMDDAEARRVAPRILREMGTPGSRMHSATFGASLKTAALKYRAQSTQNAQGAKRGRPGKNWGDKAAVKAEILRLRGKDVKVRIEKLVKQLGGSGQYSYDPATGERLIEVAVNATSPVGTARHEAMHDLFRFLSENDATRSVAKDLRDATSAPHVIKQLRDLLKDHKAALEQLNDPEERAAYAYQFWAEGLLQIGPTGTGIFHTIRQFIKDLFGIVTAGQRGEDLLRAFHDGKFADPSIVQEVLQDINDSSGDRVANKLNRAAPALTRALNSLLSAASKRLRRFENDYLNELADKFQPENGTGFVQNRFQQEGVWTNRLGGILRGTTAVERREAIDQLQAMKPTSKLAKELAKFNEDIYEYMRDAGVQSWDSTTKKFVPLRKVQGYFTRSWDPDAIAGNRAEFEALLRTEGGVSAANAAALAENLVRGSEQRPKPKESPVDLGFMPYVPHTSERVLTFINPGNADKFVKFQRKDLADIMMSYVRGSTHRAEYAREFGNNGEKIVDLVAKSGIKDPKELGEISNAVQALEGSLDPGNWSVQTKEAMSAVLTLQNVTLLPLALVSQMIDPIVLAARTGDIKDAGTAYVTALKRLKNTITKSKNKVPGEELAEILGIVSEDSTLQAMAMAYGTTRMSKRMENINRVFFKYNGMQGWNNSMRIAATAAGEKYLLAHRKDAKALAELGLEPKDIKSVGGKLDVSNPKVQQAMFQFVDQAVLRPSAANRPVWMSDPRFLLVAHLKQFTFAMHNVVLKRANRELQNGNPKPWGILMLAMPVILAADMAKFALTGTAPSTWGFKDYVLHAVERSGLLGIGDFSVQAMDRVDSGKMPGEGLLGPTFENLMKILRWIGGDPRTDFGDVVDRTVPGARFI